MSGQIASAGERLSKHPRKKMDEIFAGRLLVKLNGADLHNGQPAQPTAAQTARIQQRLPGATFSGGLVHSGWTIWKFDEAESPLRAVQALRTDPDVVCVEPENKLYTVSLPAPNDGDWSALESSSTYIFHHGSSGSGGSGSSGGFGGSSGLGNSGSMGTGNSGGSGGGNGGSGSGGNGGSNGGSNGSGNGNITRPATGATGFRRLWNLWDTSAVTGESNGELSGGWAVFPGTWYTASSKPADCPIIAFVDTGADMNHPDFRNAGGTGTDISEGGQLMKSLSTWFSNGVPVPGSSPTDADGHGTSVVGAALAAGNNGSFVGHGTIGIGYNSRGMILKVVDSVGDATDADTAAAITYAADNGAAIINVSLGTENYSQVLQDAVTYAFQKGSLVVAAGNESRGGGGALGPIYPAACSGALGVTANAPGRGSADDHYAGSGSYVGIAAPGGDLVKIASNSYYVQFVYSTAPTYASTLSDALLKSPYLSNYSYLLSGTSMAAPQVSGAAGLYYGQRNLHQSDGFSNVNAFQALQLSADGTDSASGGGWESKQGFGSLDVQQLMLLSSTANPRKAIFGDVTGIVYFGGIPRAGVTVTAKSTTSDSTLTTTTSLDGTYRFAPFEAGVYDVSASYMGSTRTKRVPVTAGCDMPGIDFFTGPSPADSTPPTVAFVKYVSGSSTSLQFSQWAYDTDTEIESATVQIGTTSGSPNLMAPQLILPGSTNVQLTGLKLPASYFVTFTYTNGVGGVSQAVQAVTGGVADATVSNGAAPSGERLEVAHGAASGDKVSYVQLDISQVPSSASEVKLALTGAADGETATVGLYGTDNQSLAGSLDWSRAPALSGSAVALETIGAEGEYGWNITALVRAARAAGKKTITVALQSESAGAAHFAKIGDTGAPKLSVISHD